MGNTVRFNEDSSIAISGGSDATVKCWDLRSKRMQPVQTLEETGDTVTSLDVSSYEVVVGSADAKVRRYDLRNGFLITDLVGQNPVTSVAISADSASILVNLCMGEPLRLFDKSSRELLQEFQGHRHTGNFRIDAVLDEANQHVLCGSEDGNMSMGPADGRRHLQTVPRPHERRRSGRCCQSDIPQPPPPTAQAGVGCKSGALLLGKERRV